MDASENRVFCENLEIKIHAYIEIFCVVKNITNCYEIFCDISPCNKAHLIMVNQFLINF